MAFQAPSQSPVKTLARKLIMPAMASRNGCIRETSVFQMVLNTVMMVSPQVSQNRCKAPKITWAASERAFQSVSHRDLIPPQMREKDVEADRLRFEMQGREAQANELESAIAVLKSSIQHNLESAARLKADLEQQEGREGSLSAQIEQRRERLEEGVYLRDGAIWLTNAQGSREVLPTRDIRLPGVHNIENYMAAIAAVWGDVEPETIRQLLTDERIAFRRLYRRGADGAWQEAEP